EKAKALLAEHCLYAMQIETVYDAETPAGVVLSQDVRKGEKVPQGTVINMRVSKGVETTRVPGVVLMGANDARNTLQAAGLKCNICYVSNGDYVMDCIMSQSIAEGELAAVGTEVWLTASIGSASYVISTGGWSGNPLPTVNPDDYTTEPVEETTEEQETSTEAPDPTEPRNTETTRAQQTESPTTAYVPAQTEPVYVPQETEMTAPPAPDTPVLVPGDLEPPPMPQ
ncbi:MAG: PASTA domain-containing protein, partial [Oscillospiraceae bacterium]|nr:PASTA domain-containing protein [Oscillospiraceae bacterium]